MIRVLILLTEPDSTGATVPVLVVLALAIPALVILVLIIPALILPGEALPAPALVVATR